MDPRVAGKIALVTGGASGIGRAAAVRLAQEGAFVFVSDVHLEAAVTVAAEIVAAGSQSEAIGLDVSREEDWDRAIERVVSARSRLDILVNCAGISTVSPIAELSLADWRRVIDVNLDGVFLGTRAAIRSMTATSGGSIVNIASVSGIKAFSSAGAYCASKAAVRQFSRVAAIECADAKNGVRVNLVTPGPVKTPMWDGMEFFQKLVAEQGGTEQAFAAMQGTAPSQRFFTAEEVAESILFFASDESRQVTGAEIVLDRGHT